MSKPPIPPPGVAYGVEGQYFICATCGKSIPITQIEGECRCQRKVCRMCGGTYPLCAKCGWVICKNCARFNNKDQKWYHIQCMPSGCLIVTACFGSPYSKEVQYLRTFRDETVLKTSLGNRMMYVLEKIYYSFSPQVARYLENHPATKNVVGSVVVVPLLQSLSASELLSKSFTNEELRIIFIAWLSSINFTLGLIFWKFFSLLRRKLLEF